MASQTIACKALSNAQLRAHAITSALTAADLPLDSKQWQPCDWMRAVRVLEVAALRHEIKLQRRHAMAIEASVS